MKNSKAIIRSILFLLGIGTMAMRIDCQTNATIAPLHYISSLSIKTEDGSSYFSDSESALNKKQNILNINNNHIAYIQLKEYSFLYFNKIKREKNANGYVDFYKGKFGEFKLVINKITKANNYTTKRNGILYLKTNDIIKKIAVYGDVQDSDDINKRFFGY